MSQTPKAAAPAVEIAIDGGDWPPEAEISGWFEDALDAAARELGLYLRYGEISAVLLDDVAMAELNAAHRGQNKPTNVLSFPAFAPQDVTALDTSKPFLLGDLVFADGVIAREALAAGLSIHHHMAHLVVHGFLHLLGYDHLNDEDADAMEALEARILARLDIADPYKDGDHGHATRTAGG
ncbi:MAG: rRNA maturation RNase YbeY [Cohaesibacteraceae bacterium]